MESIIEGEGTPSAPSNSSSSQHQQQQQQQQGGVRNQRSFIQERRRRRSLIQWPFQSIATDASSLFSWRPPTRATRATRTTRTGTISSFGGNANGIGNGNGNGGGAGGAAERPAFGRRATWDPRKRIREEDVESVNQDLIPDYVINYLRGETPEMVARRKKNGGKLGERAVDLTHQHRPHESRAGILEDALSETSSQQLGERRYILPQNGSRWKRWSGAVTGTSRGSRRWKRWTAGWRAGVGLNAFLAGIILLVEVVCLVILAAWKGKDVFSGRIVIYKGSCSTVESVDWGLHAVVNILRVVLLAGANYTFQVLSSPTREEVTAAHERKKWLDIGIPSFRNLGYVAKKRSVLATVVLLAAVLTQIISNSIIFTSATNDDTQPPTCQLNVYGSFLGITVLLNLLIVLLLTSVLIFFKRPSFTPLVTLGDAITSFLTDPDPVTRGACLLSKDDVKKGNWASGASQPKHWVPKPHRWFQTPSSPRWIIMGLVWVLCAGATAAALAFSIMDDYSLSTFGNNYSSTTSPIIEGETTKMPTWATTLLSSSLPQLLLSLLYLALNPLLTSYFLSHESSLFYAHALHNDSDPESQPQHQAQPLRLSCSLLDIDPTSSQTSSLYLTLPRPISWFLLALFAAMGFVISQSFGPLRFTTPSTEGTQGEVTGLFTSGVALTVLLGLLVLLLVCTLALGFRSSTAAVMKSTGTVPCGKMTPASGVTNGTAFEGLKTMGNPMTLPGGSCSAVISARCHLLGVDEKGKGRRRSVTFSGLDDVMADADTAEIWKRPLVWGVVGEDRTGPEEAGVGIGHCGFAVVGRAGMVTEGRAYA
ncbi:hypothetical protein B0T20DRAFT_429618 [Sordaria brevicollis]|uniref:DUF6536 domain-containing protein n=1 Tax=Sordaria brevicollis TaxID=83679 RepID=A0AAE0PNX5_SORBR|nr:hypothetical protein B0T20DRAFT_429618 [Sordaria brevicollis]